jgi:hypothetical protein
MLCFVKRTRHDKNDNYTPCAHTIILPVFLLQQTKLLLLFFLSLFGTHLLMGHAILRHEQMTFLHCCCYCLLLLLAVLKLYFKYSRVDVFVKLVVVLLFCRLLFRAVVKIRYP